MDQLMNFEQSMTVLAVSLAAPLASLIAVAVGCSDTTAKKHYSRKKRSYKRSKRYARDANKSGKSSKSSKSKSGRAYTAAESLMAKKNTDITGESLKKPVSAVAKLAASADKPKFSDSKKFRSSHSSKRSSRSLSKLSSSKPRFPTISKRGSRFSKASKRHSSKRRSSKSKIDKKTSAADTTVHSKSIKKTSLSQSMADKHYAPASVTKLETLRVVPDLLCFTAKGGQSILSVINSSSEKRFAVKAKCSDNQLYRVNPVYSFIEPNQKVLFTIYRNCGAAKRDKLVLVTAEASKDDVNPTDVFKDPNVIHPMMVVPLYGRNGNMPDLEGFQHALCTCSVKA